MAGRGRKQCLALLHPRAARCQFIGAVFGQQRHRRRCHLQVELQANYPPPQLKGLMAAGREAGLVLGGWSIGAAMFRELETAEPSLAAGQSDLAQSTIGGPGLWLRAEPDEDAGQADRLAAFIAENIGDSAP